MLRTTTINATRPRAFTLIEVMIVVVILGVLAAITIPTFGSLTMEANKAAFVSDGKRITSAAALFRSREGVFPEDSASGEMPAGFESYIDANTWVNGTPIGGVWDFEFNSFGYTSAFGVHFDGTGETRDDAFMTEVDAIFDGGDLTTGGFREIADNARYYFIVAQ